MRVSRKLIPESHTHSPASQKPCPPHIGWPGHITMSNCPFRIHVISTLNMEVISTEKLNVCMAWSTVWTSDCEMLQTQDSMKALSTFSATTSGASVSCIKQTHKFNLNVKDFGVCSLWIHITRVTCDNKQKLCHRRRTARRAMSVKICVYKLYNRSTTNRSNWVRGLQLIDV